MTVAQFWESTYLPNAEKELRASVLSPYKQIWNRFLKDHFGSTKLADYKAGDHYRLLLSLRGRKLGRRTIAHVRSVASAIFTHACNLSLLAANPIRSVNTPKTAEPADTAFYSIGQMGEILHKLQGRPDAQLLVALCFYAALRPSEPVALQWSDIDTAGGMLHVRRSCVRGVLGPCKTAESMAPVPIIRQVQLLLEAWRPLCPPSRRLDLSSSRAPRQLCLHGRQALLQDHYQTLVGDRWRGLYSGRRGGITAVIDTSGGNVIMGQMLVPAQERWHNTGVLQDAITRHARRRHEAAGKRIQADPVVRARGFGTLRDGCC